MAVDIFDGGDPVYPDIAVNTDGSSHNITDPTSGQDNVSTPVSPIPANGWPGNGIPIFSDFNKIFRLITQWIRWFYAGIGEVVTLSGIAPGGTGDTLTLHFPDTIGENWVLLGGILTEGSVAFSPVPSVSTGVTYEVYVPLTGEKLIKIQFILGGVAQSMDGVHYKIVLKKVV